MEFEKQEIEMKINNLLVNGSVIDWSKLEESGCVRPFFFLFIFYGDAAFRDRSVSTEKQQTRVNYCTERMEEINYYVLFLNSEKGESSILFAPQNQIPS